MDWLLQDMLAERPEVTQVDCMDEGLAIYTERKFGPMC